MAKKTKKAISPWVTMLSELNLDIEHLEFKDANELKAAYEAADSGVKQAAESSLNKEAELISALARMRSILSQRGGSKLRREAGVMTWTQYFAWFKDTYDLKMSLRTAIKKIDILSGKELCPSCGKMTGHTPSCPHYVKPQTVLTKRECGLIAALTAGNDLVKALECGANVIEAAREYSKLAPSPERLDQWTERQTIPYSPKSGDVVSVDDVEYSITELCGIGEDKNGLFLRLKVQSLEPRSNAPTADPVSSHADNEGIRPPVEEQAGCEGVPIPALTSWPDAQPCA